MSSYLRPEDWKFYTSVIDGHRLELAGLNLWDHEWKDLRLSVNLKDPIYGENHVMGIYEISNGTVTQTFAAGEFSNLVWGIYLPVIKN